jgi:hypothetical protein
MAPPVTQSKLFPTISHETIELLVRDGDIRVEPTRIAEAKAALSATIERANASEQMKQGLRQIREGHRRRIVAFEIGEDLGGRGPRARGGLRRV